MTATAAEHREFWTRLREVCWWALDRLETEEGHDTAEAVAALLAAQNFRIKTTALLSADDVPDLSTLRYVVLIPWGGEWTPLCDASWTVLGVSEANAQDELRMTLLQNGIGVPDDASALDSPPHEA